MPVVDRVVEFDPIAFSLGPLSVRWYGLMYLIGFALGWWLGRRRARTGEWRGWTPVQVDDLVFFVAIGVVLGGRIGYTLFYNFGHFLADPIVIFKVWLGGMSFHGGLIGVILALWLFARRNGFHFFAVADFVAPLAPLGLGFGRIGNFINGELSGRVTDVPWALVFPQAGPEPRHPSQLYEALLEGLILFVVLWLYSRRPRALMSVSGLFLVLYGLFQSLVEFVRTPDLHLGFMAFEWLTMGQILSLPMVLLGGVLLVMSANRPAESGREA